MSTWLFRNREAIPKPEVIVKDEICELYARLMSILRNEPMTGIRMGVLREGMASVN